MRRVPATLPAAAKAGLRGRGRPKTQDSPAAATASDFAQPADVSDLLELPLREILDRHQSVQGFADFLEVRKSIADTHRVESRNARDDGRLVSCELVKQLVIGLIKNQNLRLVENAPRKARARVDASARRGAPAEEIEALIRAAINAELTVSTRQISAALVRCKAGDNPPEVSEDPAAGRRYADTRLARDIERRLREVAAKEVLEVVRKGIARAVSAAESLRFDAAWGSLPQIAIDVESHVSTVLALHVTRAVTDFNAQENRE